MATTVILTCDTHSDGTTPAAKTVDIAVGRRHWSIDLCSECEAGLWEALGPFSAKTAKTAKAGKSPKSQKDSQADAEARERRDAVRAWAASTGRDVSVRGRIAQTTYEEFDAAMAKKAARKRS
jgi:hypothetical protein